MFEIDSHDFQKTGCCLKGLRHNCREKAEFDPGNGLLKSLLEVLLTKSVEFLSNNIKRHQTTLGLPKFEEHKKPNVRNFKSLGDLDQPQKNEKSRDFYFYLGDLPKLVLQNRNKSFDFLSSWLSVVSSHKQLTRTSYTGFSTTFMPMQTLPFDGNERESSVLFREPPSSHSVRVALSCVFKSGDPRTHALKCVPMMSSISSFT